MEYDNIRYQFDEAPVLHIYAVEQKTGKYKKTVDGLCKAGDSFTYLSCLVYNPNSKVYLDAKFNLFNSSPRTRMMANLLKDHLANIEGAEKKLLQGEQVVLKMDERFEFEGYICQIDLYKLFGYEYEDDSKRRVRCLNVVVKGVPNFVRGRNAEGDSPESVINAMITRLGWKQVRTESVDGGQLEDNAARQGTD
jgi:hypothetical protein